MVLLEAALVIGAIILFVIIDYYVVGCEKV
jgi:hypothetical protein